MQRCPLRAAGPTGKELLLRALVSPPNCACLGALQHGTCLGWLLAFCHAGLGVGWPVVGFPSPSLGTVAASVPPLVSKASRWLPDRGASLELHGAFTDCCLRCELLAGSLSLLRLIRLENVEFVSRSEAPMLLVLKADGLIGQHWSHCSRSIYRAGWNRCCWCPVLPTIWEEAEFWPVVKMQKAPDDLGLHEVICQKAPPPKRAGCFELFGKIERYASKFSEIGSDLKGHILCTASLHREESGKFDLSPGDM